MSTPAPGRTVPLSVLQLEAPTMSVGQLARRLADDVLVDDVGRQAVPAATARAFIEERNRQAAEAAEAHRRRAEAGRRLRASGALTPVGIPAYAIPEGVSPAQFIVGLDGQPVYEDGGRRPRPMTHGDWLDAEMAEQRRRGRE